MRTCRRQCQWAWVCWRRRPHPASKCSVCTRPDLASIRSVDETAAGTACWQRLPVSRWEPGTRRRRWWRTDAADDWRWWQRWRACWHTVTSIWWRRRSTRTPPSPECQSIKQTSRNENLHQNSDFPALVWKAVLLFPVRRRNPPSPSHRWKTV